MCGASLSGVTSERLEQLVNREKELNSKKKLNFGSLALLVVALTTTIAGASLAFFNGIGIILLLVGLLTILYIVGGAGGSLKAGVGWHTEDRSIMAKKDDTPQQEVRRQTEEPKRRTDQRD